MAGTDVGAYEAVLFDMDGVLIRGTATGTEVYARAAEDALAELGADVSGTEREALAQSRFDERMARQCRAAGLDPGTFWATRERFATEHATRRIGTGPRAPFEDTSVLAGLPGPLGIVSNNRRATVEYVAAELFPGRFEVTIGREPTLDGYRRRKPRPDYIERALDSLGVEHALYVGDREKDLTAARRAGIDGVLVRREHNRDVAIEDGAVELDGLGELRTAGE